MISVEIKGCLGSSVVERLSAFGSGRDPGICDGVPHWVPHREPASSSAYVSASLCLSGINQ